MPARPEFPPSPAWTDLGQGVRVRQSVAFHMNSIVLVDSEQTLIADPGVLPSELDDLATHVARKAPARVTLFFTHAHWDHVLGRPWWPAARTLAHDRFASEVQEGRESILREAEAMAARHGERWTRGFEPFHPDEAVSGLKFTRLDPWRLVLRDAPGHSDSALSLHVVDRRLLIAGDMLSDIELPILNRGCDVYLHTLEAILLLAEHGAIETVVPGHGSVARGREAVLERLENDIAYLNALRLGVQKARLDGLTLEAARERLADMEQARRVPTESTHEQHLDNLKFAWTAGAETIGRDHRPRARAKTGPRHRR